MLAFFKLKLKYKNTMSFWSKRSGAIESGEILARSYQSLPFLPG